MAKNFYETLGVPPTAKAAEVKAAYRRLVLKHHPDKNPDPASPQIFRNVTEAFEVLGDARARKRYDDGLAAEAKQRREFAERKAREEQLMQQRVREAVVTASRFAEAEESTDYVRTPSQYTPAEITEMVKRLSILYGRQRFADAEVLAKQIIQLDPRRALPYAVLGDISRGRGSLGEAMKMYSFALQMEPSNPIFLQRYEEILDRTQIEEGKGHRVRIEPQERRIFAVLAIVTITLLACVYIALSTEVPALESFGPISTWTVGLIAMLFFAGASAGAALSIGNLIDQVDSSVNGKLSPTLSAGLIALASFPLSVLIYVVRGLSQRAFNITTTRMISTVGSITVCLGLAAAASPARSSFFQVLLWGGNLVYLGAMGGWVLADGFRR